MAHEKYGIDALLNKYPVVSKALDHTAKEAEAALAHLGGKEAAIYGIKTIVETVDACLDGTATEKQAMIISLLYSFAPQALTKDRAYLKHEYGVEVRDIIEESIKCAPLLATDANAVAPEKTARLLAVLLIGMIATTTKTLTDEPTLLIGSPVKLEDMKQDLLKKERQLFPKLNAPRLELLFRKTTAAHLALFKNNNKNPNGPKF
jgi:hypothetical protein